MFSETYSQKLRKIIQAKNPALNEDGVDKLTSQFAELGLFLVRQWLQYQSKTTGMGLTAEFNKKPREPPLE